MSLNHANNEYAQRLAAQSRTPTEYKVEAKIYYHHHNYAKFHFDFGGSNVKTVAFANYCYITDDIREQNQLDLVADAPGTFIYTIRDSDVAAAYAQELKEEATQALLKTAVAVASVHNQAFDPNAPIVPVTVSQVGATPVAVRPVHAVTPAVVGIQSSVSGTQAVDPVSATPTDPKSQTSPPTAGDAAAARVAELAAMAAKVTPQR